MEVFLPIGFTNILCMSTINLYNGPFRILDKYVFSDIGRVVLNILNPSDDINKIIDILNNKSEDYLNDVEYRELTIYINKIPTFTVGGWGYLIGPLHFLYEEAKTEQDNFGKWIVAKLKGNVK